MKKSSKIVLIGAGALAAIGGMYYLIKKSSGSTGGGGETCKVNGDPNLYVIINGKKYNCSWFSIPVFTGKGSPGMTTHYPGSALAKEQCITGVNNNYQYVQLARSGAWFGAAKCDNGYTFSFKIEGFNGQ